MPRVSVVIPAYNNGPFIAATIGSVLAQTYSDFELIVADHASGDDTVERAQPFLADPRVQLHRTPAGGGAVANWNAVSLRATGEFIKLLPADDLIHPDSLARAVAAFDAAGPAATLVATQRSLIDANGGTLLRRFGLRGLTGVVDGAQALRTTVRSGTNIFGEPGCVTMRTAVLAETGWWEPLHYYIDAGTYAKVMITGQMVAIPEALASGRVNAGQWSVRLKDTQAAEARDFHRATQALAPHVISDFDVRLGDARAWVRAKQRRLSYLVWSRKMRLDAAPNPGVD